jgi:hypothetical protein
VPESSFESLLQRSLDALERERPDVAARLAATLAPLDVSIEVDDEALGVRAVAARVEVTPAPSRAHVHVVTDRRTILALVDGDLSLVDAVIRDQLSLRGAVADLARFHDALWVYLQGAVRAPSFPQLLRAYRGA